MVWEVALQQSPQAGAQGSKRWPSQSQSRNFVRAVLAGWRAVERGEIESFELTVKLPLREASKQPYRWLVERPHPCRRQRTVQRASGRRRNSLRVHRPAFALEQHRQSPVALAHTAPGQLPQSHAQGLLRIAMVRVAQGSPLDRNQPPHSPLAQGVDRLHPLRQLASRTRLYSFFAMIS